MPRSAPASERPTSGYRISLVPLGPADVTHPAQVEVPGLVRVGGSGSIPRMLAALGRTDIHPDTLRKRRKQHGHLLATEPARRALRLPGSDALRHGCEYTVCSVAGSMPSSLSAWWDMTDALVLAGQQHRAAHARGFRPGETNPVNPFRPPRRR